MLQNDMFLSESNIKKYEGFTINGGKKVGKEVNLEETVYILGFIAPVVSNTKKELEKYFDVNEAKLMAGAFTSTALSSFKFSAKDTLIRGVTGYIDYEAADSLWQVNKENLLNKLAHLTEFQCFTILSMVAEMLNYEPVYSDDDIRRIFNIE